MNDKGLIDSFSNLIIALEPHQESSSRLVNRRYYCQGRVSDTLSKRSKLDRPEVTT